MSECEGKSTTFSVVEEKVDSDGLRINPPFRNLKIEDSDGNCIILHELQLRDGGIDEMYQRLVERLETGDMSDVYYREATEEERDDEV
jgi:hypothetical protein